MKTKKALLPIACAALSLVSGCGGDTPVARVEIEPKEARLPFSQAQNIRLTWTPSAALEDEKPTVFVHLLDSEKKVARTFDHPFPQRWTEGKPVSYDLKLYQSALAPPLPAGRYQVTLGLYGKDNKRWALDGLGESLGRDEYPALQVEVPANNPKPHFGFSPTWLPVEPGSDRQVLARRWVAGRGAVRLVDQRGGGTLWMVVHVPPMDVPDYKLVLDPGATTPSVMLAANCGGADATVSGPGLHEVELAMTPPPPGSFCRVLVTANYVLEPINSTGRKQSASLENIAWMPAGGGGGGHKAAKGGGGKGKGGGRGKGAKAAAEAAPEPE